MAPAVINWPLVPSQECNHNKTVPYYSIGFGGLCQEGIRANVRYSTVIISLYNMSHLQFLNWG